jgi:hypothetical protein
MTQKRKIKLKQKSCKEKKIQRLLTMISKSLRDDLKHQRNNEQKITSEKNKKCSNKITMTQQKKMFKQNGKDST